MPLTSIFTCQRYIFADFVARNKKGAGKVVGRGKVGTRVCKENHLTLKTILPPSLPNTSSPMTFMDAGTDNTK